MKNLLLIFSILLSNSLFVKAQDLPPKVFKDSVDAFFDAHYEGGSREFLEEVYQNIYFPLAARSNCNSGILIVKLIFGRNGQLTNLTFYNPLGDGLENEVKRVLLLTRKKWNNVNPDESIVISFSFTVGEKEKLEGYINVIALQNCYHTTEIFQKKLDKTISKEKYDKAIEYCTEIIKRNPWSEKHIKLYEELKKKQE